MAESPLTAARIEALAADPTAYAPAAIADALARADHDDAVARAVARALAGAPLPIHELAPILPLAPGVLDLLYLVGAATGDRVETLLWLCEHERFPLDLEGLELEAAALWAVTRLGDDTAWPRVRRRVRRMQRYKLDALARSIVQLVADLVLPAGKGPRAPISPGLGHELERALAGPIAGYLDELPAQDEGARVVTGYTVRSGPKPGRNEPCPCGSGKKYKKCCMEKDEAGPAPSPVPGLSWDEYLRAGAGKITVDALRDLTTADLARVDLARLGDDPLVEALRTWIELRRFDLAERVLAVIDARASLADTRDDLRVELVEALVTARELDDARRVMAGLGDADAMAPGTRLFLELDAARPAAPDRLARIDAEAQAALGDERGEAEVELAYALLAAAPALGVLVARGALRPDRALDSDTLLDAIEQTRIALDLPGGDRAWEAWAALDPRGAAARERRAQEALEELADEEAEEAAAEAASLRELLQAANARAADLERNLTASRARLEQQAPAPARAPDPEAERERRALREKIETLEARIREGNEERAEMRRALASTGRAGGERRGGPGRTAPTSEWIDDDTRAAEKAADAMAPPRGVLIPTFAAAFEAALADVPAHVAAEAMRTVGGLAAGDPPAWRGVKQAQDIRPPLLMARVGIHHRLLFRAEERRLDLLDLVTREALMHTLKRLRR